MGRSWMYMLATCVALGGCTRLTVRPAGDAAPSDDQTPGGADLPRVDLPSTGDLLPSRDLVPSLDARLSSEQGPPAVGLVAAWPFNEGSGQSVSNALGGAGYRGKSANVDSADPAWEQRAARVCLGAALSFDGNDDVVTLPASSTPDLGAFTISFSLYATGAGGGALSRILTKEGGAEADTIVHYRAGDNAIAVNLFNTSATLFATFGVGVVVNQRANWALTFDGSGDRRVRIYKNGAEVTYLRQDVLTGTFRKTTNPWMIGNQGGGVRGFEGTIDEVRVYARVLTPAEIGALSNRCPP